MNGSASQYWQIHFDELGQVTNPADPDTLTRDITDPTNPTTKNLFIMCHGWGNQERDAERLYEAMFPLIDDARGSLETDRYLGVFWPSIWFPDPPANPAPPTPTASAADLTGDQIAESLICGLPSAQANLQKMGKLIDEGVNDAQANAPRAAQQERLDAFHQLLQQTFTPPQVPAGEDAGEAFLLYTDKPIRDYRSLAATMGSAPPAGDTQSLADTFLAVWNGAKDAMRIGSYFQMKARAGDVGTLGLGPWLSQLHTKDPQLRVHLIGHSFGARLASFSLAGIPNPDSSPVASLTLLQGAFSHWAFSPGTVSKSITGALKEYRDRVHGPLLATFSESDWAVGHWYPRASFLAQADSEDNPLTNRWGGMGADGFQGVGASTTTIPLDAASIFESGTFYQVDANAVINDTGQSAFAGAHSDIQKAEVATLIARASQG